MKFPMNLEYTFIKNDFGPIRDRFVKECKNQGFEPFNQRSLSFSYLIADDLGEGRKIYGEKHRPQVRDEIRDAEGWILRLMSMETMVRYDQMRVDRLHAIRATNAEIINNTQAAIKLCNPIAVEAIARYEDTIKNCQSHIDHINAILKDELASD